jgi:hypothetical protein
MARIFGLLLQLGSAHCLIIVAFKNELAGQTHVIFVVYICGSGQEQQKARMSMTWLGEMISG